MWSGCKGGCAKGKRGKKRVGVEEKIELKWKGTGGGEGEDTRGRGRGM